MSRSGYTDCDDGDNSVWLYRGAVASAFRGRRGQAFLKEMLAALDAMPEKKLIEGELQQDGAVCAIGAVGVARGLDMGGLDPEDAARVAETFNVARAMVREITFENDSEWVYRKETDEQRFDRMRRWIAEQIVRTDENPARP